MGKLKIGLVGCGNVSDVYIQNSKKWSVMEIVACADKIIERAKEKSEK
jgi:predicted homoserine dehydrogenase-like protein